MFYKRFKHKKDKLKIKKDDYECFQQGPIKVERIGRFVRMSSDWRPGEFEKHIQFMQENRSELQAEINRKIGEILDLIEQYDPLELMTTVSTKNCFSDPEQYSEPTHEGKEAYMEYAQSLIMGHNKLGIGNSVTEEAIEKFNNLIQEILNDVTWFFGSEAAEGRREPKEDELRFMSILRCLFLRGDSFEQHHLELVQGLYELHDAFLKEKIGFSTVEIIEGLQEIERQLNENIRTLIDYFKKIKELHQLFIEFVDKQDFDNVSNFEELRDIYNSLPEVKEKKQGLDELYKKSEKIIFIIEPNEKIPRQLLDLLSCSFGENELFVAFEKAPGWPTNDSIIYSKPLVSYGEKYYCFIPQVLFRNIGNILEDLIKQIDENYYKTTYQEKRAEYLERKALEYFSKIFPQALILHKVFYDVTENGTTKKCECDGLVLFDGNLFIIEAKAGSLSTSARRGGLERIKRDVAELIDKAYVQALRTEHYINTCSQPRFEFEDGTEALVLNKEKLHDVFLVNVTLESLGHLSTQLNSLKIFNHLQGEKWPWSVFINDLRIISELIECPSEFLTFLKRRIRVNDYPQFYTTDELDFLMYFFKEGLYFEDGKLGDINLLTLTGYTDEMDRYYNFLAGKVSSGEKPRLRISEEYKKLINDIEATGKEGFTRVTTFLLSCSFETQQTILEYIKTIEAKLRDDSRDHDFTLYFKEANAGLLVAVTSKSIEEALNSLDSHCELKMYQTHFENWFLVVICVNDKGERKIDFKVYQKKWEHNSELEQRLEEFKKRKWDMVTKSRQKVGRNELCPCGSGLKYKKCCGK
ncbi:Preprotein translocase subunit SecA [Thermincola ferriacetica]|uniref:Preprotein translocase subunit SecA n=1 Tax=Thermincola ferriacetica TaxID=281456 RepID=A0A0L6W0Q6_9FIRM|nr:SEC-C metal-binding domain-containing protein [Thermincola ferriacetica]KNZ68664.1 Preprotein translocase subunit SecA [Thermincola ferriacetica]